MYFVDIIVSINKGGNQVKRKNMGKNHWRFSTHLLGSLIIIGLTLFIDYGLMRWLPSLLMNVNDASAIGVIGGADGPTVFFVASMTPKAVIMSKLSLFVCLLLFYFPMKKLISKHYNED